MRNTLKKVMGMLMAVALLLGVLAVPSQGAQAADINKKAKFVIKEYAISKGKDST